MDTDDLNNFTEVIVSTFESTCNKKPFRSGPFQKASGGAILFNGLMCTLTFTGGLNGTVILIMSSTVACKMYGGMMMEEVEEVDEEVAEGFTEIANMIIGNIKADLGEHKLTFEPPALKIGEGAATSEMSDKTWLYIPMAFQEWGDFGLILSIAPA